MFDQKVLLLFYLTRLKNEKNENDKKKNISSQVLWQLRYKKCQNLRFTWIIFISLHVHLLTTFFLHDKTYKLQKSSILSLNLENLAQNVIPMGSTVVSLSW